MTFLHSLHSILYFFQCNIAKKKVCAVKECLKNTTTLAATAGRLHFESCSAMQQFLGALWQRVCSLAHPQAGRYCSYARTLRDSLSGTHSHTLTRSGSPQPLGGTSVLHCHNKSLNKQQQHGKPHTSTRTRKGVGKESPDEDRREEQQAAAAATRLPSSTPKPNTMPMPTPMLTLTQASQ